MLDHAQAYADVKSPEIKQFKGRDGASLLAQELLINATDVNLFVGRNVNQAHEGLNIDNKTKLDGVATLASILKGLGKTVTIKYN